MSGVSLYISHIFALAILLVAFGLVTLNMFNYYTAVSQEAQETQALLIAQAVAEEVVRLETLYRDSGARPETNGTNITLARVFLDVPLRVSGKAYRIEMLPRQDLWLLNNITVGGKKTSALEEERPYSRIVITTEGLPSIAFTYNFYNVFVKTEGSARNTDRIRLTYVRERVGGENVDKIVLTGV